MPHNKSFQTHKSFKDLIDKYEGFILDQFGVLHNGVCGLEGAPELVKELRDTYQKKLVILSNTSSSSASCKAKLPSLGFDPKYFENAVTSGQEAGNHIHETFAPSKKKALWFTWKTKETSSPLRFLELCGEEVPLTTDPSEAEYVILHGVDVLRGPGEDGSAAEISLGDFHTSGKLDANSNGGATIESILEICAERKLPMVCANPDFIMVKADGSTGYMPGTISKRYEELGGTCVSFGKPHVPHFEACLRDLGLDKSKVVHVGDSLHHDVKGANDTGIDSVFVVGGIHRKELGTELNTLPETNALEKLFETHEQMPTHVVPMFRM